MNTNDSFRKQLNYACRDIEDVLKEQNEQVIEEIRNQAEYDYDCIKNQLLYEVSQGNFITINNKKYVSCFYEADNFEFSYYYDDGLRTKNRKFRIKTKDIGVISYQPRNPDIWDMYMNEIKRLGNNDDIAIYAVIRSDEYDISCPYPTKTNDKRFKLYFRTRLCLKCIVRF